MDSSDVATARQERPLTIEALEKELRMYRAFMSTTKAVEAEQATEIEALWKERDLLKAKLLEVSNCPNIAVAGSICYRCDIVVSAIGVQ